MAELFATSKQSVSYHIINILKDKELDEKSVVKEYLTTATYGKGLTRDTLGSKSQSSRLCEKQKSELPRAIRGKENKTRQASQRGEDAMMMIM